MTEEIRQGPSGPIVEVAEGDATAPLVTALFVDGSTLVPLAQQTGFIGLPFGSAQQAVDALPVDGVALVAPGIVGALTVDHQLTVRGLSGNRDDTILDDIGTSALLHLEGVTAGVMTAGAALSLRNCSLTGIAAPGSVVQVLGDVRVGDCEAGILFATGLTVQSSLDVAISADCTECSLQVPCQGGQYDLTRCETSSINGSNLLATDSIVGVLTLSGVCQATRCVVQGPATVGSAQLQATTVLGLLTSAGGALLVGCDLQGGVTAGGNTTIRGGKIGGNVAITGVLTIDAETYRAALNSGFTVAATSFIFSDLPPVIARTFTPPAGASSNTVTLLPAGHAPGMYRISVSCTVRVAATAGTIARGYTYSSPTGAGVLSTGLFSGVSITTPGQLGQSFTDFSFMSSGVSPLNLALNFAGVTGTPTIDVWAVANLVTGS